MKFRQILAYILTNVGLVCVFFSTLALDEQSSLGVSGLIDEKYVLGMLIGVAVALTGQCLIGWFYITNSAAAVRTTAQL